MAIAKLDSYPGEKIIKNWTVITRLLSVKVNKILTSYSELSENGELWKLVVRVGIHKRKLKFTTKAGLLCQSQGDNWERMNSDIWVVSAKRLETYIPVKPHEFAKQPIITKGYHILSLFHSPLIEDNSEISSTS